MLNLFRKQALVELLIMQVIESVFRYPAGSLLQTVKGMKQLDQ